MKRVNEKWSLVNTITYRQKNWTGHIVRGNTLLRDIIEARREDKMSRGRPGLKVLDNIMDGGSYAELKKATQDRDMWERSYEPA